MPHLLVVNKNDIKLLFSASVTKMAFLKVNHPRLESLKGTVHIVHEGRAEINKGSYPNDH